MVNKKNISREKAWFIPGIIQRILHGLIPVFLSLALTLFCATAALLLPACDLYGAVGAKDANIEGEFPDLLLGTWAYIQPGQELPAERYIIKSNSLDYAYAGGGENESGTAASSGTNFAGIIVFTASYSQDSGLLIIQYTKMPAYSLHNNGNFTAVYYRDLGEDSVRLANAINLDGYASADTFTLEEAKAKFTRDSAALYVDWGVVQPQRRAR